MVWFDSWSEALVHRAVRMAWKVEAIIAGAGCWSRCVHSQEAEGDECWYSTYFLVFVQFRTWKWCHPPLEQIFLCLSLKETPVLCQPEVSL